VRFDRVAVVVNRWGYGSGVGLLLLGVAEATHEVDGLAEEVFRRLRGSRLHQFEFERELLGFGAAFRGEVVLAVEHIQRTGQDIGVIGLAHDALGERALGFLRLDNPINGVLDILAAATGGTGVVGVVLIRCEAGFQFVLPLTVAVGGDIFSADPGDGLQQELGEIAEGDGVFAGDAALRHEEKRLGKGAVDVGGSGEVGAERFEFGSLQGSTFAAAFLFGGVMSTQGSDGITAAASVGRGELATVLVEVIVGMLVGARRRRETGTCERFFYGSHTRCYQ